MNIIHPRLKAGDLLIDRYEIQGEIGQGGMQQVYSAVDNSLNRRVAIKVPINASAQKRFERSARLSAAIVHPNIAKTLDYSSANGAEFLVEELIPGRNLQQRIDDDFGSLDPHITAHVTHHLIKAVAAMNERGIIHRDLKPSNIMVSDDMGMLNVKVTDFGVATMADMEINEAVKGGLGSIAASKTVVGALAFMAPELIKKNEGSVDRGKCDVWSIGAMLHYFLFGEYPFGNELAAIQNILNGHLPDRSQRVTQTKIQFSALVSALWEISKKCLTASVDDRPSAKEVVELFSKVTYAVAPRFAGRITHIMPGSYECGFITADTGEEVFFHFDSYFGGRPTADTRVTFSLFPGHPKRRAFPVAPCKALDNTLTTP